jgi:DNA mismatch endonuclease, patch repair protein
MDNLSLRARSDLMRRIRGKDTAPELTVRRTLHGLGYRYRLNVKELPGTPDLVFPIRRKAIFVHGCFWHGHLCKHGLRRPTTNAAFWEDKVQANRSRDARKEVLLRAAGWRFLIIWECEVKARAWLTRARRFLGPPKAGE